MIEKLSFKFFYLMPVPETYRHIDFDACGSIESLKLVRSPVPAAGNNQVLIKVHAAGVNGSDIAQRQGLYPAPPSASPILGLEVSGEIVAVADNVTSWQVGDNVCALVPGGGYGQYVATHEAHCLPVPGSFDMLSAAALAETFFTVWGNLFIRAKLTADETLLIHGASGGLGNTAIQLAKAFGAKVIVTAGSETKCEHCINLGADTALDYHGGDLERQILDATGNKGVDVIFDMAAGDFVNLNLKVSAFDGRMVTVALKRGAKARVDVSRIMAKRLTWTGSTLRPQSDEAKAEIAAQLKKRVWPLLEQGLIKPFIHSVFAIDRVRDAHRLMERGQHVGKIVLDLSPLNVTQLR